MKRFFWLIIPFPLLIGLLIATVLNQDGGINPVLYLRVSLSVLVWASGLVGSLLLAGWFVWLWRDKNYHQELQAHRVETAEDRRRFLQRLDHELKNPLTAMRAGLANLAQTTNSTTQQAALSTVESQIVRLSRLTADLRKIAELETRPLEFTAVNLTQLLDEVVEFAQDKPEATDRHITLTLPRAPWPLSTVSGDWDLLYLAAYNLVDNAIKYTRPGDTIEVRAREDGTVVMIEVADTGPGIPEKELPHVWAELYRAEQARGVPGSGLGLPLVKAIIERHGGHVSLHSRPGKGTAVSLYLPLR